MQFKLLILLILSMMVAFSAKSEPLKFQHPKNGKHSSIIRIENNIDLNSCTAFVINDKIAVTAEHCLSAPKSDLDELKQMMGPPDMTRPVPIVSDYFAVYNSKGENTYIVASLSHKRNKEDTDIAFLKGNFVNFNKMPIEVNEFKIKMHDELTSCGYAGSFSPPACNGGEYVGSVTFYGVMNNYVAKGMSGGPVLNKQGRAVGVNSSRISNGTSHFAILFGHIPPTE